MTPLPDSPRRSLRALSQAPSRGTLQTVLLAFALLIVTAGQAFATSFEALTAAVEARFEEEAGKARDAKAKNDLLAMRQFYEGRGFRPAWVQETGPTEAGRAVLAVIQASPADGMVPANYDVDDLETGLAAQDVTGLADFELLLSRALVHFGRDLSAGRVQPSKVDSEVFIYPDPVKSLDLLSTAAATHDIEGYLADLAPQSANYARLKAALAEYREIAAQGGWSTLPDGETLKPGQSGPQIAALRKRLLEAGDLALPEADDAAASNAESAGEAMAEPDPEFFDETLVAAVKRFQYRHGLEQDGKVGKMTRAALNVPVEARIDQMLLNMERRRWMPDDLGDRYVFVNLADFVLKVVDGPKTIYDSRVVVGKPYHRTPVFSGDMTYIVINPFWHVPPSIARDEILPAVQKDPGYLAAKNFTVFSDWSAGASTVDPASVDWNAISRGALRYKFRQGSGDGNALGRIKFMFPNQFNVYLHDTPAKSLFSRTVRSFSHGCIRLEDPPGLAEVLLRETGGWSRDAIDKTIASEERKTVSLKRSIPVHLTYLTAWVNKDSSVHFRDDIYDRDERLRKALVRANVTGDLGR